MLCLEPARLRAQFQDGETRTVVDEDFRLGQFRRRCGQARKIALAQKSVAHFLQIHPRARAEQTLNELLTAHFQTENANRQFFVDRNMLGNVHRQRGLSHARTRRDHDHFRRMHSAGHAIEFDKAGRDSGDAPFALVKFFDRFDRFHYLVLHREHLAFEPIFADGKNSLFYLVEKISDFVLLFVGATDAFGGGGDDGAQNVFVPDDLEVITDVCGGRHEGEKAGHQRGATDRFE